MTTREEFEDLVEDAVLDHDAAVRWGAGMDIIAAWDAQAAEVAAWKAKAEALLAFAGPHSGPPCRISISSDGETGVPLTAENADRARVVEDGCLWLPTIYHGRFCASHDTSKTAEVDDLIARGATVLAWRKP